MERVNILAVVAEDQEFCRAGLCSVLKRKLGFSAVMEARSFDQLVASLADNPLVSLASVDLDLPGMDGANSLRQLRSEFPGVRLVVVTSQSTRETILRCLAAGIHGFIPKSLSACEIGNALALVVKGHVFIPFALNSIDVTTRPSSLQEQPLHNDIRLGLTQRQQEVLDLMSKGRSNKEIARMLSIAPGTVKVHVNAAFRALGVHNRVSAAAAMRITLS